MSATELAKQSIAVEIWDGAESTFVPALKKGLTVAQRKDAVRNVLQTSNTMSDRLPLINGEMLYEVHEGRYWDAWTYREDGKDHEYANFDDYVERELDMKRRKAYYLLDIYKKFVVELKLPVEILRDLSWTKSKEIVKVIDEKNWKTLIPKLHTMTTNEVRDMVKTMQGKGGAKTAAEEKFDRMIFALAPDQHNNVQDALRVAQSLTGSQQAGNNLDMIAIDFIAGKIGEGAEGALGKLDIIIKSIERAFSCTLKVEQVDEEKYAKL